MDDDRILMKRFIAGDKESFEKLIIKYRDSGINFAKRYLNDSHLAEDILQESFAAIYVYRERYNPKFSFKAYLFSIIRNKCVDFIRKNQIIPLDDINLTTENTPESAFLNKEKQNMIIHQINRMKKDYRMAIYLIEYEGLSYKEAANIMDKNLAQIKVLVYRARRKLKSLLEGEV